MKITNNKQEGVLGTPSMITKVNFFTDNDPNGIADASAFLDVYYPMSQNMRDKYAYFWQLLRENADMQGMLVQRIDGQEKPYVWVELKLLRGVVSFKVVLLSPQMFDFLVRYQRGLVSVRFTLQELVAEAEALDKKPSPQLKGM